MSRRSPTEIDMHVGTVMRARRVELRLSQSDLADRLGVTYQQIQKYECGSNRVSASRLYELSDVLAMPVQNFFPSEAVVDEDTRKAVISPDGLRLVQAMDGIRDQSVRRSILALARSVGEAA